jgi:class 3 adenylate cyclase
MATWSHHILKYFLPTLRLQQFPHWIPLWEQKQRRSFLLTTRAIYIFAVLAYPAHYFLIDLRLKAGEPVWLPYRFAMTALSMIMFGMTFTHFFRTRSIPFVLYGYAVVFFQVRSMVWNNGVPYFYAFALATFITAAIHRPIGPSLLYLGSMYALVWPSLRQTSVHPSYLISAMIVSVVILLGLRSRMSAEIDGFIDEQTLMETQRKLIESEMELNSQIRAFLPSEIYRRVMHLIQTQQLPVHNAVEEVLKLRSCRVACLFTDIRGFTKKTKNIDRFIIDSVSPNLRASTNLIETYHGIPRLIGDLIFTYFDSHNGISNLLRAISCAIALTDQTRRMNETLPPEKRIQRYISLTYGDAVVGNIGGADSSREITVLGNPANILSRIDELTKHPTLASLLDMDHLILSAEAATQLNEEFPQLELRWIDLWSIHLTIRDFPEQRSIVLFPIHQKNQQHLQQILSNQQTGAQTSDQNWREAV